MTDIERRLMFQAACETPFGWVLVTTEKKSVCKIKIVRSKPETLAGGFLADDVCSALQQWFSGGVWPGDLPVNPAGSVFQKKVWRALQQIPSGETLTYGGLASKLGSSARAVGGACRRNPVPLLIPCHRVVAANGDGGFAGHTEGYWMEIKRWLLDHE